MKSKFYRLYVNGCKEDVLIYANNMTDALHLAGNSVDETSECVKVVFADEKTITMDEVRTCVITSFSEVD